MLIPFPVGSDFYYSFALTRPDGTPATGKLDVQVYLSDSDGGAAIAGVTQYTAAEMGTSGTYAVTFLGADSAANVGASRVGRTGSIVVSEGASVTASDQVLFVQSQRVAAG